MKGYVGALRLPICIMGSSLVLVSARLDQLPLQVVWLKAVFVLATMSATMAWNDWRDRQHDVRKGKVFANQHERDFKIFVSVLWALVILLATIVLVSDPRCWPAALGLVTIGGVYSELRLVPLVPNVIVALASALPILLVPATHESTMIFWATAVLIFAREIIKDYEDIEADRGCKWTLPLVVGSGAAMGVAATALMAAAVLLRLVSATAVAGLTQATVAVVACWIAADVALKGQRVNLSQPKLILDIGIAIYLLSVIITGAP